MRPNPKPDEAIRTFDGKCTVVQANSGGPEPSHLLQMYGGVLRILFRELEAFVGECLNLGGKLAITRPKLRRGVVIQILFVRPSA